MPPFSLLDIARNGKRGLLSNGSPNLSGNLGRSNPEKGTLKKSTLGKSTLEGLL